MVMPQERHRIDVDCRRTDRTQPLFAAADDSDNEKSMHMRYSTISPQLSDIGAQSPTNEHIERMASVLLTYHIYEKDLGKFMPFQVPRNRMLTLVMCRICTGDVGPMCPDLCGHGRRRGAHVLVFCRSHESHGKAVLKAHERSGIDFLAETKFLAGPKWHEAAVIGTTATNSYDGS